MFAIIYTLVLLNTIIGNFNVYGSFITKLPANANTTSAIYLCGGYDGSVYQTGCYKYDTRSGDWPPMQPMDTSRAYFGFVAANKKLYAINGWNGKEIVNTVESYNTQTNQWKLVASLKNSRDKFDAAVINNTIYVCGGENEDTCEYYLDKNLWEFSTPMGEKREGLALVSNGAYLYAIGGYDGYNYLSSMERYDPTSRQWVPMKSMHSTRAFFGAASFKDKIFVCGGHGTGTAICESYDPKLNQWTPIASIKDKRFDFKLIAFEDELYAFGGYSDYEISDTVEVYNYLADKWAKSKPLPHKLMDYGVAVL
ncbi:kelch-like protein diablo [Oppia nitens]|uniref:kelch-like protein diablo n=1 Tax=Oppia nitens TaxID=1686743 RepID=UPI0023DC1514|nr:kelch-like protein diablo [Oppia nitens]